MDSNRNKWAAAYCILHTRYQIQVQRIEKPFGYGSKHCTRNEFVRQIETKSKIGRVINQIQVDGIKGPVLIRLEVL